MIRIRFNEGMDSFYETKCLSFAAVSLTAQVRGVSFFPGNVLQVTRRPRALGGGSGGFS